MSLSHNALHREAATKLPSCTVFLQALWRSSENPISTNRAEAFPVLLELWSSNQSEWLYSNQSGLPLGPTKLHSLESLHEDRPMWGPGAGTSVLISQLPSGSESTLSLFIKDWRLSLAEQKHWRCLAGHSRASCRTEQSCPVGEGPGPRAALQLCCFPSHTVSQFSCFALNKVSLSPHPKLGIPVGTELAPMTTNWPSQAKLIGRKLFQHHFFCLFWWLNVKTSIWYNLVLLVMKKEKEQMTSPQSSISLPTTHSLWANFFTPYLPLCIFKMEIIMYSHLHSGYHCPGRMRSCL